jgi:hypothetical protein
VNLLVLGPLESRYEDEARDERLSLFIWTGSTEGDLSRCDRSTSEEASGFALCPSAVDAVARIHEARERAEDLDAKESAVHNARWLLLVAGAGLIFWFSKARRLTLGTRRGM